MIKKYKKEIIFFYVCAFVSLLVATFFDLSISQKLNNPSQVFSTWFYDTGEMPARLICPLAGVVMFYLGEKIITKILGLISCIGGSAYLGYHIGHYMFKEDNRLLFGIIFGLGIGLIFLFFGKYISFPTALKKPLVIFAYAGIIAMFVELGIVESSKFLWSRMRFREMLKENDFSGFTEWYRINLMKNKIDGVKTEEFKSMPSGHAASSAMCYLTMALPFCFDKLKDKTTLCFAVPFVYTSVVAYTRIVLGAHFLSDVTIGAVITFTVIIITMAIVDKKTISPLCNK